MNYLNLIMSLAKEMADLIEKCIVLYGIIHVHDHFSNDAKCEKKELMHSKLSA